MDIESALAEDSQLWASCLAFLGCHLKSEARKSSHHGSSLLHCPGEFDLDSRIPQKVNGIADGFLK